MGSCNKKLKNNVDGDENTQFLLADDADMIHNSFISMSHYDGDRTL